MFFIGKNVILNPLQILGIPLDRKKALEYLYCLIEVLLNQKPCGMKTLQVNV